MSEKLYKIPPLNWHRSVNGKQASATGSTTYDVWWGIDQAWHWDYTELAGIFAKLNAEIANHIRGSDFPALLAATESLISAVKSGGDVLAAIDAVEKVIQEHRKRLK